MKISKMIIKNYKSFKDAQIEMDEEVNIFVGENDSGKTTILDALIMTLTGRINGGKIEDRLSSSWFNNEVRENFRKSISSGNLDELPKIEIEAFLVEPEENETALNILRGTNNSLHEDACGIKIKIQFNMK